MPERKEIPALGDTPEAVWQGWRDLTERGAHSHHVVVGVLTGEGVYSWRGGELMREFNGRARRQPHGYVATIRPATADEVNRLWKAVECGWLQIEARTRTGCTGLYFYDDAGKTVKVYHQATGRALMSDLANLHTLLKRAYLCGTGLRLTGGQVRELHDRDTHGALLHAAECSYTFINALQRTRGDAPEPDILPMLREAIARAGGVVELEDVCDSVKS